MKLVLLMMMMMIIGKNITFVLDIFSFFFGEGGGVINLKSAVPDLACSILHDDPASHTLK